MRSHAAHLTCMLFAWALGGSAMAADAVAGKLPLGELAHDGPATPEQLSLILPVTGDLANTATATVRFKEKSASDWTVGHPLHRIRADFSEGFPTDPIHNAFAWPLIDLSPGKTYDVEVTVTAGAVSEVKKATFTTRALPAPAGKATKKIAANAAQDVIQAAFNGLTPGDVLEFENGTYKLNDLRMQVCGTHEKPIVIRGASRDGVTLSAAGGRVIYLINVSYVVIENLTLQGSGVDSGTGSGSVGVATWSDATEKNEITLRNLTMKGVDKAFCGNGGVTGFLMYDTNCTGNNTWISPLIDTNATWNDDGINIGGVGNCAFNNTLTGFGDTMSFNPSDGTLGIGIHFYRNDIRNSCDDMAEVDYAQRNLSIYDNRCHNSMTFVSLDPLRGGPLLVARNIAINIGRTPFKWNSGNSGQFVYNNTMVRTTGRHWVTGAQTAEAGWYQPDNGPQRAYGYQNNILVYRGVSTQSIRLDNPGHGPLDFSYNSWFPDKVWQWPEGRWNSLAETQKALPATEPVFSGIGKRHEEDNITTANPWTDEVKTGENYLEAVTGTYLPTLAEKSAPKNSGTVIANITDGFSGKWPDRGAVISGRKAVQYGDRSAAAKKP